MKLSYFSKQLLSTLFITIAFVLVLTAISTWTVRQFQREDPALNGAIHFALILSQIPEENRIQALEKIESGHGGRHEPTRTYIVRENGDVLFPQGAQRPLENWSQLQLPQKPFEAVTTGRPGAPGPVIVRLDSSNGQFLISEPNQRFGGRNGLPRLFVVNLASLIVSVILGTTLSLFILFSSLRRNARLADSVLSELQRGNLKARFPIKKLDEIGQAMLRFNKMAEEIERLVERIKTAERSRMTMLQELAHDLRTPVASLKNMLETLSTRRGSLKPELEAELTSLSLNEVNYFEHLVEDLLFLAQASEPQYDKPAGSLNPVELLQEEIGNIERIYSTGDRKVKVMLHLPSENYSMEGDVKLLRRLFRNTLENAFSFAKSQIVIGVKPLSEKRIEFSVSDDGPGFSKETLEGYGHRKASRVLDKTGARVSIGLGSVIIKTVAQLHRGEAKARNRTDNDGNVIGGEVTLILPIA